MGNLLPLKKQKGPCNVKRQSYSGPDGSDHSISENTTTFQISEKVGLCFLFVVGQRPSPSIKAAQCHFLFQLCTWGWKWSLSTVGVLPTVHGGRFSLSLQNQQEFQCRKPSNVLLWITWAMRCWVLSDCTKSLLVLVLVYAVFSQQGCHSIFHNLKCRCILMCVV